MKSVKYLSFCLWMFSCSLANKFNINKENSINGVHLIFSIYHIPPFDIVVRQPNGNYSFTGSGPSVIEWLSIKLNFTYSYVVLDQNGAEADTVLLTDLLARKEVDGTAIGLIPTMDRIPIMDFSYVTWVEQYTMVVPVEVKNLSRLFSFIEPFQPSVWLLVFVSVVAMTTAIKILYYFYKKMEHPNNSNQNQYFSSVVIYIVGNLANQGSSWRDDRFPFRISIGGWLLVALVLVNSYSSTITSFLTVTKTKSPINSLEELASSSDVNLVLLKNIAITRHILEGKSPVLKKLADQIQSNPNQLAGSLNNVMGLLLKDRYAFPYLESFSKFFVARQFKQDGGRKCRFHSSNPLPMYGMWYLPLQKNSQFTDEFRLGLMKLWETGMIAHWVKSSIPSAPKCFAKVKPQTSSLNPIQLKHFLGVFVFFGTGVTLSLLVFILETIQRHC